MVLLEDRYLRLAEEEKDSLEVYSVAVTQQIVL
jgi:hypothetical protein